MRKEQEQPAVTIRLPRDLHIFLNRVAGTGSGEERLSPLQNA